MSKSWRAAGLLGMATMSVVVVDSVAEGIAVVAFVWFAIVAVLGRPYGAK